MKKAFNYYAITWLVLFLAYNLVVFSIRPALGFNFTYDARFWVSWIFVIAAFIAQIACAFAAFYSESKEQFFLNIPLIRISYTGAVLITLTGSACILIPDCPVWVAYVACVVVTGFTVLAVIKAQAAAEVVLDVGERMKVQTQFITSLTVKADNLMAGVESEEIRMELRKLYEEVRYSDPVSPDGCEDVEKRISNAFSSLNKVVYSGNADAVKTEVHAILGLLNERNHKCKAMK